MMRTFVFLFLGLFSLAACSAPTTPVGPDGQPGVQVYRISDRDTSRIQFRMLDAVNTLREAAGVPPVKLDSKLNAAAATHSRDMAVQNRPWHFGSDGSSPVDRIRRVGYTGTLLGENISETYETELQTLSAWMSQATTRAVILDRSAREMGFSWHQEASGKLWWTLVMGGG